METFFFFPNEVPSSQIILACVKLTKLTKLTSMGMDLVIKAPILGRLER